MTKLNLPARGGQMQQLALEAPRRHSIDPKAFNRVVYAAAHVVADPLADVDPWLTAAVDFDRTLAFREYLWSLGFGVAEAMDTAQRGMGLDWPNSIDLIRRTLAASRGHPDRVVACGAGTDHLPFSLVPTIEDVIRAYEMQCEAIEQAGGKVILMASRALAACARGPEDYARVYDRVLGQLARPAILHWLGEAFDPALAGYWGSGDHLVAMETALQVIVHNAGKVEGIKISLLSAEKEILMRRRLPPSVLMFSGDDFNYSSLIKGDGQGVSHALLGIFDGIAAAAAGAMTALGRGQLEDYDAILEPTVPLSRHIFATPTRFYKTGIVFLAYLNGFQDHFAMVGGQESARSTLHLAELVRLASAAGALLDPEMAAQRARPVFAARGVEV